MKSWYVLHPHLKKHYHLNKGYSVVDPKFHSKVSSYFFVEGSSSRYEVKVPKKPDGYWIPYNYGRDVET